VRRRITKWVRTGWWGLLVGIALLTGVSFPALAQSGFALDTNGVLVRKGFGANGLDSAARGDPAQFEELKDLGFSATAVALCPLAKTLLAIVAVALVLMGMKEMIRAASGAGSWTKVGALIIIAGIALKPNIILSLVGLAWVLPTNGWSCL